jgi:hypothetical protein
LAVASWQVPEDNNERSFETSPWTADHLHCLVEFCLAGKEDVGSLLDEALGRREPYAAASARDDDNLVLQSSSLTFSLFVVLESGLLVRGVGERRCAKAAAISNDSSPAGEMLHDRPGTASRRPNRCSRTGAVAALNHPGRGGGLDHSRCQPPGRSALAGGRRTPSGWRRTRPARRISSREIASAWAADEGLGQARTPGPRP